MNPPTPTADNSWIALICIFGLGYSMFVMMVAGIVFDHLRDRTTWLDSLPNGRQAKIAVAFLTGLVWPFVLLYWLARRAWAPIRVLTQLVVGFIALGKGIVQLFRDWRARRRRTKAKLPKAKVRAS